jgi:signal transduction histidine kinase/CheY-like chemotaxis protein
VAPVERTPAESLRVYLRWVGLTCVVSLASYALLAITLRNAAFARLSVVALAAYVGAALVPSRLLAASRHQAAALVTAHAWAVVMLLATIAFPEFYVAVSSITLIPALLGFFYLRERPRALVSTILASVVAGTATVLLGRFLPSTSQLDKRLVDVANCVFFVLGTSNTALLLNQYRRGLVQTVDALQTAHDELAEERRNLERRVTERTAKLQTALDVLERKEIELVAARDAAMSAARAKAAFLASMSHEIRTPLNAIIGMTGLLLDSHLPGKQREVSEIINNSGEHLLSVINDILDFSRIEAGAVELEAQPFELRTCVEDALDLVALTAEKRQVELAHVHEPSVPPIVIGDSHRVRQVLTNLLSNAVKFTDSGGEVIVRISAKPRNGREHEIEISVRDTGIGMKAEEIDRLFQPFAQADSSTSRKYGGTGLGLAISKRLVDAMGGAIHVESEPRKGSTFRFTFRATAADAPPRTLSATSAGVIIRGLAAMVVDDNEVQRTLLKTHLESYGMTVSLASSGKEALELLPTRPDVRVVVLDHLMPGIDGLTLAKEIRKTRDPASLAIVMVGSTDVAQRAVELSEGAIQAAARKPVKHAQLRAMINFALTDAVAGQKLQFTRRPREEALPALPHLRVLLAEDNVVNQRVALGLLERLGQTAEVVSTGEDAVRAVKARDFDVVLMDVQMPELDGHEATRRIRKEVAPERQPHIVAMTANALDGDRDHSLSAGMNDFLSKPVRLGDLAAALARVPTKGSIDRSALDALAGAVGGEALQALIKEFVTDATTLVAKIERSADAPAAVADAAHQLKSTSGSMGAIKLQQQAAALDALARAGQTISAEKVAALQTELASTVAQLTSGILAG